MPTPSRYARLKKLREDLTYWRSIARLDRNALRGSTRKVARLVAAIQKLKAQPKPKRTKP